MILSADMIREIRLFRCCYKEQGDRLSPVSVRVAKIYDGVGGGARLIH